MIAGSAVRLKVGVSDVGGSGGNTQGMSPKWIGQPFVPLREATYEEWATEHDCWDEWPLERLRAYFNTGEAFFYEVSTD
jgi:hypothetical protein